MIPLHPHEPRRLPAYQPVAHPIMQLLAVRERQAARLVFPVAHAGHVAPWLLWGSVWAYLALLITTWFLFRVAADRWWFASVMLFGPRSVYAFPLAVLVPAAAIWNRRLWRPLLASALIWLVPIMGFCLPWGALHGISGDPLRVLTCNITGEAANRDALSRLIVHTQPDLVALQESTAQIATVLEGYHVVQRGELIVACRWPVTIDETFSKPPAHRHWKGYDLLVCKVDAPQGPLYFCTVHLTSPRWGLVRVLDRSTLLRPSRSDRLIEETSLRREQTQAAAAVAARLPGPVILVGDLNTPIDSTIYGTSWSAWQNAFSEAGWGLGHTMRATTRFLTFGIRIDHILYGAEFVASDCWVGPDVGSEHLPLVADLVRRH